MRMKCLRSTVFAILISATKVQFGVDRTLIGLIFLILADFFHLQFSFFREKRPPLPKKQTFAKTHRGAFFELRIENCPEGMPLARIENFWD